MRSFNFKVVVLLILISIYLVFKWLPGDQILAGGDVGIPVFSPQKQLSEVASAWWESHATGITSPITFTAVPFYLILAFFENLGTGIAQKGLFFLIIFGGSVSMFALALIFNFNKWTALISALFYIFNLTSLSVWQRGVNNGMLMLLLAPLSLLILAWGINKRSYSSIILINTTSFLLSYVFGALGFLFSIWLLWFIYLLTYLASNWFDKRKRKFILAYSFLLIISWIGTNFWWILHFLQSSGYALGQFSPEELKSRGSDVLFGLKPYHNPLYVLRGLNAYYFYGVRDWGNSYLNPFMILLSWIPVLVIFSTTLFKVNYKLLFWRFLVILTATIFILSKGVNPPLGLINAWPYDLFPFLAPLRNPYEKVGILLVIPFSLLFAYGLEQIKKFFRYHSKPSLSVISMVITALCLTMLVWPLWLGKIFISEGRKYTVSIPPYYTQANNWLKNKVVLDDTRVLHLPLSWGESVDYNWGYTGIEPSQYFFSGSSVGYQIGVTGVDLRIRDLLITIHNQDTLKLQKSLASLNIGWVVIHNETNWRPRTLEPVDKINKWVALNKDFLKHQIDFGPLSIYKVQDSYRLGHFYSTNKVVSVENLKPQTSLDIWNKINAFTDSFITQIPDEERNHLNKYISEDIVLPNKIVNYQPLSVMGEEISFNSLAKIKILPDSLLYFLVTINEKLLALLGQKDHVINCFSLSSKRLKEAAILSRQNKYSETKKSLVNYKRQLKKCSNLNSNNVIGYMSVKSYKDLTLGQLIRQQSVLEREFSDIHILNEGKAAKIELNKYLAELGFTPKYIPLQIDNKKERIIYDYYVANEGYYKIKFNKSDKKLSNAYPKIIQIDDQIVDFNPTIDETEIWYPGYKFSKGLHEIQIQTELNNNLLEKQLEVKKSYPDNGFKVKTDIVTGRPVFIGGNAVNVIGLTFDLADIQVEQDYKLSFEVILNNSMPAFVAITHDGDPYDLLGNQVPSVKWQIDTSGKIEMNYSPALNSTYAKLAFVLFPSTSAEIKNISLTKNFSNNLILEKVNDELDRNLNKVDITWKKVNPTLYEVNLSNQKTPYLMVFSETFHPLWQIKDISGKTINLSHFSINGFSNGWLVEEPLPQKIKVEFILQNYFLKGIVVSTLAFFGSILLFSYLDRRK